MPNVIAKNDDVDINKYERKETNLYTSIGC